MKQNSSQFVKVLLATFVGAAIGALAVWLAVSGSMQSADDSGGQEPLYWVAPMDPNFRRDGPGLSPMGMELIPVYEESQTDDGEGPGTIRISPDVVHNLGVKTALVERKVLSSDISTVGFVRYDEDNIVHAHPRVEGWIEKLYIKAAGDPVKKGEPLYALYSPELVAAQEEFILALKRGDARMIQASENRLRALHIPSYFIAQLKASKKVQQTVTFYVSQDGVVDHLAIREGFFVRPGDTILSIASLEQVWIEVEVFETQASLVAVDNPVTMTLDFLPYKKWQGKVDYIYPSLNAETRTLRVRLRFDNPNRQLKPNMFAQVTIQTQAQDPALVVPADALIRTGKQNRVVLALGEGQFKSIAVDIGRTTFDFIEVLSGVKEGERVVTAAQFLLDSESSQSSDFKRMHHDMPNKAIQSADTVGTINHIDSDKGLINISRGPIEKWGRPAATLDFVIGSTVDVSQLQVNDDIAFTFEIREGEFVLTQWQHPAHHQHNHAQE